MMLTQETPAAPQTARRRTDWAKLFWMMKSSPLTLIGGVIIVPVSYTHLPGAGCN